MEHVEYAYTAGMSEAEVEERLREEETGVLALADGDDAYAIPLAHYYDGESLYFRLGETEGDTKSTFLESTSTARYVLYGTEPADDPDELDSWSVLVSGWLRRLPEDRHGEFDTAEINRRFAPIRVFGEDIAEIDISIVELEIEAITGRKTPEE